MAIGPPPMLIREMGSLDGCVALGLARTPFIGQFRARGVPLIETEAVIELSGHVRHQCGYKAFGAQAGRRSATGVASPAGSRSFGLVFLAELVGTGGRIP